MADARTQSRAAGPAANAARILVGLIWLAGAAFNAVVTLRMSEPFTWLESSPIPPYRWFFRDIIGARPMLWVALLVVAEATMGALTLARGRSVRLGLGLGALFSAFLFTLATPYTLVMGGYAALLGWLARKEYPVSAIDQIVAATRRLPRLSHR